MITIFERLNVEGRATVPLDETTAAFAGWLAQAWWGDCWATNHSDVSRRVAVEGLKAQVGTQGAVDRGHVLIAEKQANVLSAGASLDVGLIETVERDRCKHVAFRPHDAFWPQAGDIDVRQWVMPSLGRLRRCGGERYHGAQISPMAGLVRNDDNGPLLHHFWRSKAGVKIADKDFPARRMVWKWHGQEKSPQSAGASEFDARASL